MSVQNFIPSLWSARILANLYNSLVYGQVVNRDYEGQISNLGDSVRINSIGRVSVKDYSRNTDIDAPDALTDAQRTLTIDQAKYFNFSVDDVDALQANGNLMDAATREAAYALGTAADQYIASLYTAIPAANMIGADNDAKVPTAATAYDMLVDMAVRLDEVTCPKDGRYVVVAPWFHGLLLKDDRFVKAGTAATDAVLRTGLVGQAAGLEVFVSNNTPNTAGSLYKFQAGCRDCISFADQINKVEAFRPQARFSDALKGLHLYGAKVTRPDALVLLTANKG